jgi:hypothetical protein
MKDPDWLSKTLMGGLFSLLGLLLIGNFFVVGYLARFARNVAAGMETPLPAWDTLGEYFVEGLKLVLAALVYIIPFIFAVLLIVIPAAMLENSGAEDLGGGLASCGVCLIVPLALLMTIVLPAAYTLAAVHRSAAAMFDFKRIFQFIKVNVMNYVLAILVYLVANSLSQVGVVALCVGIFWTAFISLIITVWAFAETYRLSPVK